MFKSLFISSVLLFGVSCNPTADFNKESVIGNVLGSVKVTISTPLAIDISNEASYALSGTCSENSMNVDIDVDGISASPVCLSSAWSTILDVSSLSDGAVVITADHTNASASVSSQAIVSVNKNTALPLELFSGAYRYINATYATNCVTYLNHPDYNNEGSSMYWIDPDGAGGAAEIKAYCDMSYASGGWTRVFVHDLSSVSSTFSPKTQAAEFNVIDPVNARYSILSKIASIKNTAAYEFVMKWPGTACDATPHHWTQTSNPIATTESVTGYVNINGGAGNINNDRGLCLSSSGAYLDGNCGHGNWYYAIGQSSLWSGGIPGCTGSSLNKVELYIR